MCAYHYAQLLYITQLIPLNSETNIIAHMLSTEQEGNFQQEMKSGTAIINLHGATIDAMASFRRHKYVFCIFF